MSWLLLAALLLPQGPTTLADTMAYYTQCYAEQMLLTGVYEIVPEFTTADTGTWVAQAWAEGKEEEYPGGPKAIGRIEYVLPALANEPDWYRRATVIHELFHLLTWPLGLLAEEADPVMGGRIFEATAGLVEYWAIWGLICSL